MKEVFANIAMPLAWITAILSSVPLALGFQIQPELFALAAFTAISFFFSEKTTLGFAWVFISFLWAIQI